ncbi:hypothetical protein D7V88_18275 [Corallococcus terminator]|uniref:Uncharacterized protein n=1 Tax=Corallococcus terminator TaxID=2316733 RepID=A0A3A8IU35_9BACT|nr:hypothetical protein D7V88_18275 [Corallococcus terminator]
MRERYRQNWRVVRSPTAVRPPPAWEQPSSLGAGSAGSVGSTGSAGSTGSVGSTGSGSSPGSGGSGHVCVKETSIGGRAIPECSSTGCSVATCTPGARPGSLGRSTAAESSQTVKRRSRSRVKMSRFATVKSPVGPTAPCSAWAQGWPSTFSVQCTHGRKGTSSGEGVKPSTRVLPSTSTEHIAPP